MHLLKKTIKDIFLYPKKKISQEDTQNNDNYWLSRRPDGEPGLNDWQVERVRFVQKYIKENEDPSVVDIGCGDGGLLYFLKKKRSLTNVIGVDISEVALSLVEKLGIKTFHSNIVSKEDFKKLPEADIYLLFEVLEHIPSAEITLQEAYRKSQKAVFFSVPNSGYITYRLRLLFGKFPAQWSISPSEHLRFWTFNDMKWWLNAQQYTNYKIYSYKGVPILNKILPGLFSAGLFVYIRKEN